VLSVRVVEGTRERLTASELSVGSFVAVRLKAAEEEAMPQQQGSRVGGGEGGGGGDINGVLPWLPLLVSGLVVAHLLAFVSFVSFAPVPYGRLFSLSLARRIWSLYATTSPISVSE